MNVFSIYNTLALCQLHLPAASTFRRGKNHLACSLCKKYKKAESVSKVESILFFIFLICSGAFGSKVLFFFCLFCGKAVRKTK